MFFRRKKTHEQTFAERLAGLEQNGFLLQEATDSRAVAVRDGFAAVVEAAADGAAHIGRSGLIVKQHLAALVSHGFQTTWRTPNGAEEAATARQLHDYHEFLEDLREGLGLTSLYNEALGTTHTFHQYDRVAGR